MEQHQLAGEAGRRAPSWYLRRGDKRYGPLADRELLLLAERGGLQTNDLLWKPGFTTWKSVHAVCGVDTLRSIPVTKSASLEDAEYLPLSKRAAGRPRFLNLQILVGSRRRHWSAGARTNFKRLSVRAC
ncbi:MAG: DUF4339 domain-containing protein, partial [Methyloceanibacter sp.]